MLSGLGVNDETYLQVQTQSLFLYLKKRVQRNKQERKEKTMELVLSFVLFAIGIALVVKGGDVFVDAATWMAEVSGIPKFIIGATVVSVATTLPELFVSVIAASQGKVDMSIGNAVGSVTANIGLIMALSLIFIPMAIK